MKSTEWLFLKVPLDLVSKSTKQKIFLKTTAKPSLGLFKNIQMSAAHCQGKTTPSLNLNSFSLTERRNSQRLKICDHSGQLERRIQNSNRLIEFLEYCRSSFLGKMQLPTFTHHGKLKTLKHSSHTDSYCKEHYMTQNHFNL